jgi:hypothetical protein
VKTINGAILEILALKSSKITQNLKPSALRADSSSKIKVGRLKDAFRKK